MAYGLQYDDIIKKETMMCAEKEPEALQILQKQEDKDMVSYARLWKTMEEKGVSKIVSVLLSDAIKHAQEG